MNQIKTSIIIPVYNEEEAIERVIAGLKIYLSQGCEIVVVNDGSTDQTKEILEKISNIKIIHHPENRGYGAAIKSGVQKSQGEYVLIIDADGSYPSKSISELIGQKDYYDMVVGARINPQSQIPLSRRPTKWALNQLANYLTKTKIPDLNSGLRIIQKNALNRFMYLLPNGFSFTTTITLAFLTNGYKVKYLPINYYKRKGKSKIRPIRDTLNFLQLIIKTVLYFNPLKIFIPLSLLIFAAAIIVGVGSILFAPKFMDTTFIVLCATALQTFFFGLLAEIIVHTRRR
ncbi:Undecaprenyl-phosphate 4-deoxy-4-formamido-L-arabinose transferase [subsurface metagenome]